MFFREGFIALKRVYLGYFASKHNKGIWPLK
jgi:hypothetical protein